jgi:predicted ABC-type ATPase
VKDLKNNKSPEIVVFAGPNGSGKSTFTELLKPHMDYINADDIKNVLIGAMKIFIF